MAMRNEPNPEEQLTNAALFLCLAGTLQQDGVIGDRLKIQKCTFLVTLDQFSKRLKGFNLTFYRYTWGPFSKQLYDVRTALRNARLITTNTPPEAEAGEIVRLTKTGASFAAELWNDIQKLPHNAPFVEAIASTGDTYRGVPTHQIIEHVYDLAVKPLRGPEQTIRDMPMFTDITQVLEPSEAEAEILIPQSWLETLAIMSSPQTRRDLADAEDDLRSKRVYSHAEVWA